jgi:hypothetical protein
MYIIPGNTVLNKMIMFSEDIEKFISHLTHST